MRVNNYNILIIEESILIVLLAIVELRYSSVAYIEKSRKLS